MPYTVSRLSAPCLAPRRPRARAGRPTLLALAVAALLGSAPAGVALAKTATWTGGAPTSGKWSNRLNWGGSTLSDGDELVFAGTGHRQDNSNDLLNASFNGLSFASGAGAFTLNGNAFTSLGNITNYSSNRQTLAMALTVGSSQSWVAGLSGLQFGEIDFASIAAAAYTVSGLGTLTVVGGINNNSNFRQSFASALTVAANQTWNGGVAGLSVNGLIFDSAAAYTLKADNVYSAGQIVNRNTSQLQTLNGVVNLTQDQTWTLGGGLRVAGLGGSGNLTIVGGKAILRLGSGAVSTDTTYSGVIAAAETPLYIDVAGSTHTLTGKGGELSYLQMSAGTLRLRGGSLKLGFLGQMTGGTLSVENARLDLTTSEQTYLFGNTNPLMAISGAAGMVNSAGGLMIGYVQGGRVQVSDAGSLQLAGSLMVGGGDGTAANGSLTVTGGGTVQAQGVSIGYYSGSVGAVTVDGTGSRLINTRGGMTLGTGGGQAASLLVSNGGLVSTSSTVLGSAGSNITVNGGTLVTGLLSGRTGTIVLDDGDPGLALAALTLNGTSGSSSFGGSIAGGGSVVKTGGATQVLSGTNSFTGGVTVTGGLLQMASGAASLYQASGSGTLQLDYGTLGWSAVQADAGGTVVYNTPTLTGGTLLGDGTHDVSRVTRYVGTSVGSGATLALANNTRLIGVVSAGTLNVAAGRSLSWSGGSNAGGRFNVDGTASVAGWTSSGVLQVGTAGVLNVASSDLVLLGGSRTAVGSKAAPGGRISLGTGHTVELNGALLVNNGNIDATTNVHYGSLAKGAGVYGAVNVFEGGVFEAGNSPGTVRTGATTWNAGGSYLVAMDQAGGLAGVNSGLWNIDGTLAITAAADGGHFTIRVATLNQADQAITLADFNAHHDYSWLIASASGGISGYAPGLFSVDSSGFLNPLDGGHFSVAQSGNHLMLNFTAAVPEPTSAAMLGLGVLVLGWARRRRADGASA
ncbi:autotransporter-associated beta strand repeat-containing protein [Ideonella sp. DXS22W]|uniref:Autotransporter-associated beta strand repeat-containing protein n=1 Tax=Pseudaquabacterium inlustre TaxID=2984192 RepID=A0ABU9CJ60_9BURK